jgi:predicted GIY-YIG superfamily endonuclease
MNIDLSGMINGFLAAWSDMTVLLVQVFQDTPPHVLVMLYMFLGILCGAWFVQMLERLTHVFLFRWLGLLRRLWLLGFSNWCVFPGCGMRIKARYRLCHNHFLAASRYQWEHRDSWGKKDKQADAFWVYLLELDGGKSLYAGQTRNLMRRLQEHCEGTTKTTAGRRPALVWFEQVGTRQAAVEKEADLKHRIDTQLGDVRQMVHAFRGR